MTLSGCRLTQNSPFRVTILLNSYEIGNPKEIEKAQNILLRTIESFAKDISEKYINPPYTTDFAILFLPIESLYAEVLRHPGLFESLQRKYRITITKTNYSFSIT